MLLISTAPAAVLTDRPLLFSFDGADTSAGHLVKPFRIAVDNSNGSVYVSEGNGVIGAVDNEAVCKFGPDGAAANFSATGASCLGRTPGGYFDHETSVAVDNSGSLGEGEQGRIYVVERSNGRLSAFAPSGAFLWELEEISPSPEDVAVDTSGHPWVLFSDGSVRKYASSGAENPLDSLAAEGRNGLDLDASGNVYVASFSGVRKYAKVAGKWELDSILDPNPSYDVFADQSSAGGHIFTLYFDLNEFCEYDPGTLVGCFDKDLTPGGRGIAYNKALDHVYLAGQGLGEVDALGPPATGTVPEATSEAPTVEGPGTATLHGTVNPQGVANAYYFEWADGHFKSIFTTHVFRSPRQTLPEDSLPHPVSFKARSLMGEPSEWRVRLVGVNTDNDLRAASNITTFKTPKATEPPMLTIDDPAAISAETARISGTVNPREDSAIVGVFSDPGCTTGAFKTREIYVPGGEVSAPVPVELELRKLTPGAHYCVFLATNNSFGIPAETEVKEFDTPPPPPSEVSTAFAAPRTDTTARINGHLNPEGEADFTYRFEWSEDGVTWTQRPLLESSINAQEPIVVADELTGLEPSTTYHYRLAFAENETGPATEIGDAKTFTTRTSAEMALPPNAFGEPGRRGIELVNNPEKGNQNVFMISSQVPFIAPNGERALWSVTAGAPGSPSGVGGQFLAERTGSTGVAPNGWQSRSLEPPAAQQFGGGKLIYRLAAGAPDFSRFIVDMREPGLVSSPKATIARLDTDQNEEVLQSYKWVEDKDQLTGLDVTEDGAHVLLVGPNTEGKPFQLEDIGAARVGPPAVPGEVISLMPDGTPSECGLETFDTPSFIANSARHWRPGYHMIATTNASLVYFRAKPNGECGAPWGLYLRDREAEETVEIDQPAAGGENVEFVRTTPDGRHGYFLTKSTLDPADLNSGADLYRWDHESRESSCLTCVVSNASITSTKPVLVSDDFSHAYFQSTRQLVPGEGIPGAANVYALSGGTIRFVAAPVVTFGLKHNNARLSADGKVLVFRSLGIPRLTADVVTAGEQVYHYDEHDRSLECLSCVHGEATTHAFGVAGGVNSDGDFQISADGSTVGFATQEALVPLDVNRETDIYEWRNGSRRLITDGLRDAQTGSAAPGVRGIDADGSNILLSVTQPGLTGFERDDLANLYDARIGGGFVPPSPPVHCVEDSCQGPLAPPPIRSIRNSSSYVGTGNQTKRKRRPCARKRGKAKRRCVRHERNKGKKHKRHARKQQRKGTVNP